MTHLPTKAGHELVSDGPKDWHCSCGKWRPTITGITGNIIRQHAAHLASLPERGTGQPTREDVMADALKNFSPDKEIKLVVHVPAPVASLPKWGTGQQEESCGTVENVITSTSVGLLPTVKAAWPSEAAHLLPEAEWNQLSPDSQAKVKKWFEIATEHLQGMIDAAAPVAAQQISLEGPERLARAFHEAYERLAPSFGYETRKESSVPWEQVPEQNRKLMMAVCNEIMAALESRNAKS